MSFLILTQNSLQEVLFMKKLVVMWLSFLVLGTFCGISFAGREICPSCNGSRSTNCTACYGSGVCPTCNGRRRYYVPSYGTGSSSYVNCSACHGSGTCWRCNGSRNQYVFVARELDIYTHLTPYPKTTLEAILMETLAVIQKAMQVITLNL